MPKQVDHQQRRQELADAACRVVAREGVDGASLRLVADQAGWSIGSMRYYFATKGELLTFSLRHVGNRIEERVRRLPPADTSLQRLRAVVAELLPLDEARREESLVWIAFVARAAVDAELAAVAEGIWRQLHEPFARHLAVAIAHGEIAAELDAEREATRLQALVDGLCIQLVTVSARAPTELARSVVDDHFAALTRPSSRSGRG